MIFTFMTSATMKPYNRDKWYIMSDYIRPARIEAENAADALSKYAEKLETEYYITISKNALKNKSDMFIDSADGDPVKTGYVITAATDFQADNGDMKKQYIDLWITILNYAA